MTTTVMVVAVVAVLAIVAAMVASRNKKEQETKKEEVLQALVGKEELELPGYPHIKIGVDNFQIVYIKVDGSQYADIQEAVEHMEEEEIDKLEDLANAISVVSEVAPTKKGYEIYRNNHDKPIRFYEEGLVEVGENMKITVAKNSADEFHITKLVVINRAKGPKEKDGMTTIDIYVEGEDAAITAVRMGQLKDYFISRKAKMYTTLINLRDHQIEMCKYNEIKANIKDDPGLKGKSFEFYSPDVIDTDIKDNPFVNMLKEVIAPSEKEKEEVASRKYTFARRTKKK